VSRRLDRRSADGGGRRHALAADGDRHPSPPFLALAAGALGAGLRRNDDADGARCND
jgi:hypothetical protein